MAIIPTDPANCSAIGGKEKETELGLWSLSTFPLFSMKSKMDLKQRIQKRWVIGGLALLLFWTLPLSAFCQKASIKEVSVKGTNGAWEVGFYVENCFTEKMEEAIQTGIRTIFTFYLNLYQKRSWWKDRKVASIEFHHSIQYDPIRGEYHVTLEEKRSSHITSNMDEAKRLMAMVKEVEVRPSTPLNPGIPTHLRIKAELDPVRLPLRLEYLFFFVSLWDFETDWHIESLPP
jgi:hypothetical protein